MGNRFAQRNQVVPEFLRYGMLAKVLPDDRLRAASMLVDPGYLTAEHAAAVLQAAGMDEQESADVVRTAQERYRVHLEQSEGMGDWERFDAAFDEVADRGIIVRHNFTCCRTCANEEIDDERTAGEWGYVYFSQQDALELAYGRAQVYLGFGVFDDAGRRAEDVASHVVAALTKQGLVAEWDGDAHTRIQVVGMDWRRPLA
ncbi:hypothetical protein TPB0596_18890 [Tsukamurella pulmonis]|uniref:DUF6891 domain-containing protein n=1 Tax=Tsukamurella pulmonis TaxID=47312 RepID=UPI001EDD0722|nr:hypothetical protein [Tsukamurella pulmonis]BDD82126.1 hypothetical protein TPB0596_18890 [Tsukamurella pulmonis]